MATVYKNHKLPKTLPGNWIASCKQPSSAGCYETFICVRAQPEGSFDKYVVHSAYYRDEGKEKGWYYACGDYCKDLPSALSSFSKRAGLVHPHHEA